MTEAEWLASTDPTPMLEFLRGKVSDRKLRLFAVACARRVSQWFTDERSREAIEISEQFADGLVGKKKLSAARRAAFSASKDAERTPRVEPYCPGTSHAAVVALHACQATEISRGSSVASNTADCASSLVSHLSGDAAGHIEVECQAALIRCIFGNLFPPVTADPGWLTSTAVSLATGIFADRAFDRLPILADALEEAGCNQPDILNHLRGDGPHVRGCWALDLILGKK